MAGKPFLFEKAFDSEVAEPPRKPARKLDEAAVAAEREAAFAQGFAKGEAQGRAEARAEADARVETVRETIAGAIAEAAGAAIETRDAIAATAPVAAARAIRTAFPALALRIGHAEIRLTVQDALDRALDEGRIVVRLAAGDFADIELELAEIAAKVGFPGKIVTIEDAGVAAGDVRVEWADGGLVRDTDRLTSAIATALEGLAGDDRQDSQQEPS